MATDQSHLVNLPIVIHFGPVAQRMSEAEFYEFCQLNRHWRIERTPEGDVVLMPPCGGGTGRRESELLLQLGMWSRRDATGVVFSPSTGFRLPDGGQRSPDASWVRRERWDALSSEEQETFPPIVPDFVAELRSKTDSLPALRARMREYIDCGARLGWLIDPQDRRLEVFRPGKEPEVIENPLTVSAEPELPGFVLELTQIWS